MKYQLTTLFIVLIGLVSCQKSSDPEPDFSVTLTSHTWANNGYTAIVDGTSYVGKNTKIDINTYKLGPDATNIYTFKSDGTYVIDITNGYELGKWTLSGNELTMNRPKNLTQIVSITNKSTSGFTMTFPEISPSDQSDLAFYQLVISNYVVASNGIDTSKLTPKKIQTQLNLITK